MGHDHTYCLLKIVQRNFSDTDSKRRLKLSVNLMRGKLGLLKTWEAQMLPTANRPRVSIRQSQPVISVRCWVTNFLSPVRHYPIGWNSVEKKLPVSSFGSVIMQNLHGCCVSTYAGSI